MLYRYLYNHNVPVIIPKISVSDPGPFVHIRIQIGLFFPSQDLDPVRNKNPDRIRQIRIHEKRPKNEPKHCSKA